MTKYNLKTSLKDYSGYYGHNREFSDILTAEIFSVFERDF